MIKTPAMNIAEKRLIDNFCCAKCRGKAASVEPVMLETTRIWSVLTRKYSPRFYAVTCGLCGYTELYNARVYALQDQEVVDPAGLPQKSRI